MALDTYKSRYESIMLIGDFNAEITEFALAEFYPNMISKT